MEDLVKITRYPKGEYYELIRQLDERKRAAIIESQIPLRLLSKRVAESVVTDRSEPVPDCLTCGVCCAFALIVPVTREDSPRLKEYWDLSPDGGPDEVTIERVLPRNVDTGCCAHLGGELKKRIACEIYTDRPQVCHDFDVGSDRCHAYRRMYGLEPPLPEERLAEVRPALESRRTQDLISDVSIDVESVSYGIEMTAESVVRSQKAWMSISVFVGEDESTAHRIHQYNASDETWFESDLLGLTLEQAADVIALRTKELSRE